MTETDCVSGRPHLEAFSNLRELSWKGLLSTVYCKSLKAFLELHHENLTSLEIDFIDWTELMGHNFGSTDDVEEEDDFAPLVKLILPERKDNYLGTLPNLKSLSLSEASFKGPKDRVISGFNLASVDELRLIHCQFTDELLEHMTYSDVRPTATKVELTSRQVDHGQEDFHEIDILAPFNHLEDVFLMIHADWVDDCYLSMILRHQDTVRRLVYHRQHYDSEEESPYSNEYCDSSLDPKSSASFANLIRETRLESFGICAVPSMLQIALRYDASEANSLKLLHLRFTGKAVQKPKFFDPDRHQREMSQSTYNYSAVGVKFFPGGDWQDEEERDMKAFADWAFGPHGFPNLTVLASGDFSRGKRFATSRTLWCRNTGNSRNESAWRTVKQSDIIENDLIHTNMDMLSACPLTPLFYRYHHAGNFPGIS